MKRQIIDTRAGQLHRGGRSCLKILAGLAIGIFSAGFVQAQVAPELLQLLPAGESEIHMDGALADGTKCHVYASADERNFILTVGVLNEDGETYDVRRFAKFQTGLGYTLTDLKADPAQLTAEAYHEAQELYGRDLKTFLTVTQTETSAQHWSAVTVREQYKYLTGFQDHVSVTCYLP